MCNDGGPFCSPGSWRTLLANEAMSDVGGRDAPRREEKGVKAREAASTSWTTLTSTHSAIGDGLRPSEHRWPAKGAKGREVERVRRNAAAAHDLIDLIPEKKRLPGSKATAIR